MRKLFTKEMRTMSFDEYDDPRSSNYTGKWQYFSEMSFLLDSIKENRRKEEFRKRLIMLIRRRPALWDKEYRHKRRIDKKLLRSAKWKEVAELVSRSVDTVKKEWSSLRSKFKREMKTMFFDKNDDPSLLNISFYAGKWRYFRDMFFLIDRSRENTLEDEFKKRLITEIRKRCVIWDGKTAIGKHREKDAKWNEVAEMLSLSVIAVKYEWYKLRSRFRIETLQMPGLDDPKLSNYTGNWRYFSDMFFLRGHITKRSKITGSGKEIRINPHRNEEGITTRAKQKCLAVSKERSGSFEEDLEICSVEESQNMKPPEMETVLIRGEERKFLPESNEGEESFESSSEEEFQSINSTGKENRLVEDEERKFLPSSDEESDCAEELFEILSDEENACMNSIENERELVTGEKRKISENDEESDTVEELFEILSDEEFPCSNSIGNEKGLATGEKRKFPVNDEESDTVEELFEILSDEEFPCRNSTEIKEGEKIKPPPSSNQKSGCHEDIFNKRAVPQRQISEPKKKKNRHSRRKKNLTVEDEDLVFVKSIVPDLKKLGPIQRLRLRSKIQSLIADEMSANMSSYRASELPTQQNPKKINSSQGSNMNGSERPVPAVVLVRLPFSNIYQ